MKSDCEEGPQLKSPCPVCMACVPARDVDLECKHLVDSADVAAAGAQGCSCDSLVYVYLRREQDGVHGLSNLTKIKNNIGNVYLSCSVHIHYVYSSPCVHIHHVYSSTSFIKMSRHDDGCQTLLLCVLYLTKPLAFKQLLRDICK